MPAGGAEVIHGIDVAYVEALRGSGVHALQRLAENFRVRLFVTDESGVGDGTEATGDAALVNTFSIPPSALEMTAIW